MFHAFNGVITHDMPDPLSTFDTNIAVHIILDFGSSRFSQARQAPRRTESLIHPCFWTFLSIKTRSSICVSPLTPLNYMIYLAWWMLESVNFMTRGVFFEPFLPFWIKI